MAATTDERGEVAIHAAELAFRQAERRYFEHERLAVEERYVQLALPPLRARLLERGNGDPVLMLHGGGGIAAHWAPLMARLDGYHLVAVDRPGCGLTDPFDNRGVDLREHAVAFVTGLLDALGISRAHIVANSMGATWSLWFALAAPDRVRSLALLGCPANVLSSGAPIPFRLLGVPRLNARMLALEPPSPRQARTLFARLGHRPDSLSAEFIDLMARAESLPAYQSHWLSLLENTWFMGRKRVGIDAHQLRELAQPVQLIWGDRDPFGSPAVGAEMSEIMQRARLVTLAAGHLPWVDEPDRCAEIVREFLETSPAR
jgi:pimeloyl-ACP methyl ester carboxylesterase